MTQIREPERRSRILRGRPYSLDEFASKYGLQNDQAESLFTRFGPSSIELDLLMAAKRRAPARHDIAE
ncbi:hypothetical protein ATY78_17240 [Rhizobium sp. R635]|uniref:hypothetical protein n=1 Tax=unclassified Rhizobium TaxID=2613769 RepID=UPI000B536863|nr:hypothetical protein [Rhizobium sp. R635]OWV90224.1 hypothetical protein ATY78_17240 [Rhizobium sp. R635]